MHKTAGRYTYKLRHTLLCSNSHQISKGGWVALDQSNVVNSYTNLRGFSAPGENEIGQKLASDSESRNYHVVRGMPAFTFLAEQLRVGRN